MCTLGKDMNILYTELQVIKQLIW